MKVASLLALFVTLLAVVSCQNSSFTNDNDVLNYALTLEHLELAYYTQGLARYNTTDFSNAGFSASVYAYIGLIRDHENAHVTALTATLQSRGAVAVGACTYNFNASLSSVSNFLATARVLEETGVTAYDGSANRLTDSTLLQIAATIATTEARHAAYLNQLVGSNPFPNSFDNAMTPTQVIQAASGFIVSCPNNITLPVIYYTTIPTPANATYNLSGQAESQAQFDNDNKVLNFSLYLENLGHAFYSNVSRFNTMDFINAGYSVAVYNQFQNIITHENAHFAFFNNALTGRGATPTTPCSYNLGSATTNVTNALNFARMLENLEVTAYDGAINSLTDYSLLQGAATIATVEARHAEYLNNLLLGQGVQNASFDTANSPATILNITAPFFGANCVTPAIPQVASVFRAAVAAASPSSGPVASPSSGPVASSSTGPVASSSTGPVASSSTGPVASSSTGPVASSSPVVSSCPVQSSSPSTSMTMTPSTCPGSPTASPSPSCSSDDDDDNVVINFYFADMLRM